MPRPEQTCALVTGAGGFVGSAVSRALIKAVEANQLALADGRAVDRVVCCLRPGGSMKRLEELTSSEHWSVSSVNVFDSREIGNTLARVSPSVIVHCASADNMFDRMNAGLQSRSIDDPLKVMLEALETSNGRFITTGTAAVMESSRSMDETSPLVPNAGYFNYATNKIREEEALRALHESFKTPICHLRLFYMFGRYEASGRLLPTLVDRLRKNEEVELSHGTQIRDYTDVDEIARAYLRAVAAPTRGFEAYNVGSGRGISIREFAETVAECIGDSALLTFGRAETRDQSDNPYVVANPAKARRDLGWEASPDQVARIRDSVRWWLANAT